MISSKKRWRFPRHKSFGNFTRDRNWASGSGSQWAPGPPGPEGCSKLWLRLQLHKITWKNYDQSLQVTSKLLENVDDFGLSIDVHWIHWFWSLVQDFTLGIGEMWFWVLHPDSPRSFRCQHASALGVWTRALATTSSVAVLSLNWKGWRVTVCCKRESFLKSFVGWCCAKRECCIVAHLSGGDLTKSLANSISTMSKAVNLLVFCHLASEKI